MSMRTIMVVGRAGVFGKTALSPGTPSAGEAVAFAVDHFARAGEGVRQRGFRRRPAVAARDAVVAVGDRARAVRPGHAADDHRGDVAVATGALHGAGVDAVVAFGSFVEMHGLSPRAC